MIRIAALNESFSSEGSESDVGPREATKEAKEAEAFTLYGKALDLLRQGKSEKAEEVFQDLTDHEFLIEAYDLLEERGKDAIHPGLQLLYSIQKNLAAMATKRKDYKAALDCYLEAVKIDNSEVTVWYKVGMTALVIEDFQLAMLAFEQGLDCNPKHWPCLDNVISILYATNNYIECLYYIARAFELDATYGKGYALRNKIWAEQSSLKKDTEEFFENCDPVIYTYQIDPDEAREYVEEAQQMRRRNQIVCKPPDPERLQFPARIKQYSWKTIGEILIGLYDKATTSDPPLSLGLRVDVPDYSSLPEEDVNTAADLDASGAQVNEGQSNSVKVHPDGSIGTDGKEKQMECDETGSGKEESVHENKSNSLEKDADNVENKEEMHKMDVDIEDSVVQDGNEAVKATVHSETETDVVENAGTEEKNSNEQSNTEKMKTELLENSKEDVDMETEASDNVDFKNRSQDTTTGDSIIKSETNINDEMDSTARADKGIEVHTDTKDENYQKEPHLSDNVENKKEDAIRNMEDRDIDRDLKEEMSEDIEKSQKEEFMETENISEDSSSIQEALITAHALLDSLSPMKPETFPGCPSGRSPKSKNEPGTNLDVSDRPEIVKPYRIQDQHSTDLSTGRFTKTEATVEDNEKVAHSQTSAGLLTKSSSYGFTVSDILSDEMGHDSKDIADDVMSLKEKTVSTGSDISKEANLSENIEPVKTDVSTIGVEKKSEDSPIVIDSSSSSQGSQSRLQPVTTSVTPPIMSVHVSSSEIIDNANPLTSVSQKVFQEQGSTAIQSSSSVAAGYQSDVLSALHVGTSQTVTGSSVTTSVEMLSTSVTETQSEMRPPIINISSPSVRLTGSVTDHGYSRAYNEMPLNQSTPRRSPFPVSMAARSPGSSIVLRDSQSSASYIEVPLDIDDRSPSSRKAQKRKRPSLATEDILNYGKRRSARVRNTGGRKKEEETVNFYDLLQTFLPSSLKNVAEEENSSMDTDTSDTQDKTQDKDADKSGSRMSAVAMVTEEWNEVEMVKCFLDKCIKNCGLLDMCSTFLHILARHFKVQWPEGLSEIYMGVFSRVRKHLYIPNVFEMKDPPKLYQKLAQICLVQAEFLLDTWLLTRSKVTGSSIMSPRSQGSHSLETDDVPQFFDEDIWYLTVLCGYSETMADIWIDHCIRVYWLKARYSVLRNNMGDAVSYLEMIKEYLEYGKEEFKVEHAYLPNCKIDNFVDTEIVLSQQELLHQTRSVEETEKLYENKDYKKVVEILKQNFSAEKQKMVKMTSDKTERQAQWIMLLEALYKTEDYSNCLLWGEQAFSECYQMSRHGSKSEETSSWIKTMISVFSYMQRVFEKEVLISQALSSTKIIRFSQNLIRLINLNMSLPESMTAMAVDTVIPWILLYYIIKQEEDKLEERRMKEDVVVEEKEENLSSSYMLLNIAHDYLGSRSWCTKSDGALLLFFMSVLKKDMCQETVSKFQEEYQQAFEQCVYCLFGHPNKKGKAKHLQDHSASNISLQWEHAVDVFEYFKPKSLPEFDGYRSETISTEVEFLLKRIIPLIPENSKSMGLTVEEIQSYIEGTNSTTPVIQDGRQVTLPVVDVIYYLLADYYLKNKEAVKAIKFYMQDLCMNPSRLDSWAGMALARMSQLDSKLTSAELKMDQPVYKKSIAALRCFKRAVEIDDTNSKLWIEYGTLAYQLHSHASRQIEWKKWFAMDEETVKIAVDSKREMLQTATDCFRMAAGCDRDWSEDEWLHNYMLGKCLEKNNRGIKDSLGYYSKALECVHKEHAKYPKRIQYAYNTPHLAVEALEMYYRIHVIILKQLLKYDAESDSHDYKLYVKYIVEAANTPFVKRLEYGQTNKTDRDSASSADENSCTETTPSKSKSSSDHTYFRQKSIPGVKPVAEPVAMETEKVEEQNNAGVEEKDVVMQSKSVTTLELHSEEQKTEVDINMATVDTSKLPRVETSQQGEATPVKNEFVESKADKESANLQKLKQSPFSISSILGEKPSESPETPKRAADTQAGGDSLALSQESKVQDVKETKEIKHVEVRPEDAGASGDGGTPTTELETDGKKKAELSSGDTEKEVKNVLAHIEDLIEEEMKDNTSSQTDDDKDKVETMEVDGEDLIKAQNQQKSTSKVSDDSKIDDQINYLLKMPVTDLHKELVEKCRLALTTCLQRFPTHYKSHYRLAYIHLYSPYHKDLMKAHHILLGAPKWQDLDYMPCQGLFGERKQTKFFQGIWKIPIDEIDRSGSFPSHLNRCIGLVLDVLRAEKDSQTLHQVHLQLNRQPEPGKKYLRDAEKKYYALTSHRYTLDAVEQQIEDMKAITDTEVRQKFLMVVYKIHEHGVHKLNKHVERTNRLLAEAYRVTLRKLETLPQKMFLDQAVRYCKQLQSQKHKGEKSQDTKSQASVSTLVPASIRPNSTPEDVPTKSIKPPNLISLANIMESQGASYSMQKATESNLDKASTDIVSKDNSQSEAEVSAKDKQPVDKVEEADVIILSDSSVDSPVKSSIDMKKTDDVDKSKTASPSLNTSAPTVKIKMGLLQAVKKLKPNPKEGTLNSGDNETSQDEGLSSALSEDESEAPLPSASDDQEAKANSTTSSSSSSSSSSESGSSSDESSDDDDGEADDGDNESDDSKDEESDSNDSESDDDDNDGKLDNKNDTKEVAKKPQAVKRRMKVVPTTEDEEESSDNDNEIDLISSNDEADQDDDRDKDYNASEDDIDNDVIMISDEEYAPKGKAIIPSPPHKNILMGTEVLVKEVPDFDPSLISSLMSADIGPVPVGSPIVNKASTAHGHSSMDIDKT
ncbi:calcineurin-binding protein cabin-1-like isoform X2 [Mercenaria mercenaria]|uniref:calcineurin-binding protein cabin-1-like isoform X2 n=1 Tax=Mercenaria mercenaria TaxID=6596 RepID=UPI00234E8DB0|nr:calcineurin-binding protein cabin-1-like isoform X2 [Mercenaria mercenaria]